MDEHPPTQEHNFIRKIAVHMTGLFLENPGLASGLYAVEVCHDDWCDLLRQRGFCNCDPKVKAALSVSMMGMN